MTAVDDRYPIADASDREARAVAGCLRAADRAEIIAATGTDDVVAVVRRSVATSRVAHCAWADGAPAVLWGVAPASWLSGTGVPWMVATPALETHWRAFLRRCRPEVAAMAAGFQVLRNHVDARNRLAVKWLEWLGFTAHAPQPFGPFGLPFHEFELMVL